TTVPERTSDRGRLVQYISDEQKLRNKAPTWERLASEVFNDVTKADYTQSLLRDRSVPEHVRTWPQSSETCKAGCEKPERSGSAERPDESSGGGEETARMESGAANAGGADAEPVAERVEAKPFLAAIIVLINQTIGGEKPFVSTLQLQRVALDFCVACRQVPSLALRVRKRALLHLQKVSNSPSRIPTLRPSSLRGKCIKEALLLNNYSRIDCRRTSSITFRNTFDEPIVGFPWPCSSLRQLVLIFGDYFNQPIVSVEWPRSLHKLKFDGLFDQPVEGILWPRDLRELDLGLSFNRPIERVAWTKSLRVLRFGPCFNQPIERVEWPPLAHMEFDIDFDQPIAKVGWPESLQRLTLGDNFNREIEHVNWPSLLQELEFGDMFNKGVENVSWPAGLKQLAFGSRFDQPIERVKWPACLEVLIFGDDFNQPIEDAKFPESLKNFTLGLKFEHPIANVSWPQSFEHLHFENTLYHVCVHDFLWLPSLKYVTKG
ncbi:unnamed protein product, partial [Ectocarpus fasciculatus]